MLPGAAKHGSMVCRVALVLDDGTPLPHDECPMAIALKEGRTIWGAQAVAERPDGTRVPFMPHPTRLRDASGVLVGAVNMLLELGEAEQVALNGVQILIVAADMLVATLNATSA